MRKSLLLLAVATFLGTQVVKAQQPDAIYIANWDTLYDLGQPVTPNENDPKLTYNSQTGCYEGEVIDWPRMAVNPYNAKIPYSVEGDVITYYGVAGHTQSIIFNTYPTNTFSFQASTSPEEFKGFGISSANNKPVEDVKVSMNLNNNEISFTSFDSGIGTVMPTLVSVYPENGSLITLNEDGGTTITITFDGPVDRLEVQADEYELTPVPNDDMTVWTVDVPANVVATTSNENQGRLILKVYNAFANGLPVGFIDGSPTLSLAYSVSGVTSSATVKLAGDEAGLKTLNVYKAPEYSVGDEFDFDGNSFDISYKESVTFLFTVGKGYEIKISSELSSNNGENWKTGEGFSTEKGPNGETTNIIAAEGTTLTLYPSANGAVFTVTVSPESTGVDSIFENETQVSVYNISGICILKAASATDIRNLKSGIYIVNGKKVVVK